MILIENQPPAETYERLLSRKEIAHRWGVSTETVKRRSREGGELTPIRFNQRLVRYRMSDVLRLEEEAPEVYDD